MGNGNISNSSNEKNQLLKLSKNELIKKCKKQNLQFNGSKLDMVNRLSSGNKSTANKPPPKSSTESKETTHNIKNDNTFGIYMLGSDSSLASNVLTTIQAVSKSSKSFNDD
eukprot:262669_1